MADPNKPVTPVAESEQATGDGVEVDPRLRQYMQKAGISGPGVNTQSPDDFTLPEGANRSDVEALADLLRRKPDAMPRFNDKQKAMILAGSRDIRDVVGQMQRMVPPERIEEEREFLKQTFEQAGGTFADLAMDVDLSDEAISRHIAADDLLSFTRGMSNNELPDYLKRVRAEFGYLLNTSATAAHVVEGGLEDSIDGIIKLADELDQGREITNQFIRATVGMEGWSAFNNAGRNISGLDRGMLSRAVDRLRDRGPTDFPLLFDRNRRLLFEPNITGQVIGETGRIAIVAFANSVASGVALSQIATESFGRTMAETDGNVSAAVGSAYLELVSEALGAKVVSLGGRLSAEAIGSAIRGGKARNVVKLLQSAGLTTGGQVLEEMSVNYANAVNMYITGEKTFVEAIEEANLAAPDTLKVSSGVGLLIQVPGLLSRRSRRALVRAMETGDERMTRAILKDALPDATDEQIDTFIEEGSVVAGFKKTVNQLKNPEAQAPEAETEIEADEDGAPVFERELAEDIQTTIVERLKGLETSEVVKAMLQANEALAEARGLSPDFELGTEEQHTLEAVMELGRRELDSRTDLQTEEVSATQPSLLLEELGVGQQVANRFQQKGKAKVGDQGKVSDVKIPTFDQGKTAKRIFREQRKRQKIADDMDFVQQQLDRMNRMIRFMGASRVGTSNVVTPEVAKQIADVIGLKSLETNLQRGITTKSFKKAVKTARERLPEIRDQQFKDMLKSKLDQVRSKSGKKQAQQELTDILPEDRKAIEGLLDGIVKTRQRVKKADAEDVLAVDDLQPGEAQDILEQIAQHEAHSALETSFFYRGRRISDAQVNKMSDEAAEEIVQFLGKLGIEANTDTVLKDDRSALGQTVDATINKLQVLSYPMLSELVGPTAAEVLYNNVERASAKMKAGHFRDIDALAEFLEGQGYDLKGDRIRALSLPLSNDAAKYETSATEAQLLEVTLDESGDRTAKLYGGELMGLYNMVRDGRTRRWLREGNEIQFAPERWPEGKTLTVTEETIQALEDTMDRVDPVIRNAADFMFDRINDVHAPAIDEVSLRVTGNTLTREERYWRMAVKSGYKPRVEKEVEEQEQAENKKLAFDNPNKIRATLTSAGIAKERLDRPPPKAVYKIEDAFVTYSNHSWWANGMTHMFEPLRTARRVLDSDSVTSALRQSKRGFEFKSRYDDLYNDINSNLTGIYQRQGSLESGLGRLISNVGVSLIAANMKVAGYQYVSVIMAANVLGAGPLAQALSEKAPLDSNVDQRMMQEPRFRFRAESSGRMHVQEEAAMKSNLFGRKSGRIVDRLLFAVRGVDHAAMRTIWRAAEIKAEQQIDPRESPEEYAALRDQLAWRTVSFTQPTRDPLYATGTAMAARKNRVIKALALFRAQIGKSLSLNYFYGEQWKGGVPGGKERFTTSMLTTVTSTVMVTAIAKFYDELLSFGEDEDESEDLALTFMERLAGHFVFGDKLALLVRTAIQGEGFHTLRRDPVGGVAIDLMGGAGKLAGNIIRGEGLSEMAGNAEEMAKGLSSLYGLPLIPIFRDLNLLSKALSDQEKGGETSTSLSTQALE